MREPWFSLMTMSPSVVVLQPDPKISVMGSSASESHAIGDRDAPRSDDRSMLNPGTPTFYRVFYRTSGNGGTSDGTMAQGRGKEAQVNATIRHAMVRVGILI